MAPRSGRPGLPPRRRKRRSREFGRATTPVLPKRSPSPGRWIRPGRCPPSGATATAQFVDWPADPHQTPSGGGHRADPGQKRDTGRRTNAQGGLTTEGPLQKGLSGFASCGAWATCLAVRSRAPARPQPPQTVTFGIGVDPAFPALSLRPCAACPSPCLIGAKGTDIPYGRIPLCETVPRVWSEHPIPF
jgi:hypothetical protein